MCKDCNIKRVFDFDLAILTSALGVNDEAKAKMTEVATEYQKLIMNHAMHSGYILAYKFEKQEDLDYLIGQIVDMYTIQTEE